MLKKLKLTPRKIIIALVVIALLVIAGLTIPNFLSMRNILKVMRTSSIVAIVSFGSAMVIIVKGIDLSVGGLIAVCAMVSGLLMTSGIPVPVAILAGLVVGGLLGLFSGVMVEKLEVPAFITTLVIGQLANGFALVLNGGDSLSVTNKSYDFLGNGKIFGVPVSIFITLFFLFLSYFIMNKTKLGTHIYALGGNKQVVKNQGISTAKINYFVFAFSGICAAAAGILLSSQLNTVHPTQGGNYQLDAVAACVIGGINMAGGEGKVYNAIIGALIIGFLRNALNLIGLHPYYQNLIVGVLIISIVAYSMYQRRKKNETSKRF